MAEEAGAAHPWGESLSGCRWSVKPADPASVERLSRALAISRLTARVLVCRGIAQTEEARQFLGHDLGGLLDPQMMKDMARATGMVEEALAGGRRIRIYGDYDVDGVCATALLVRALRGLGGEVDWYIPHRVDEGYGVNEEAVRQAKAEGVDLLITVDCGSTAAKEIAFARELGLEVIVTDHHRPDGELPEAVVLNPWRPDCPYPFKELAGVGVAFKLVSALARARGLREGEELRFLDLVCLGTVGDVVPLLGENRLFVRHGLSQLPRSRKVGVTALMAAAGIAGPVGARQVAFGLAPRINAAGRMEHAQAAVRLLLTRDQAEAEELAAYLCQQNDRRREQEQQTLAEAEELVGCEVDLSREKVIVLASESWHPGVIGIVASRLVERYHRPVLLIAVSDGQGKGSGRSIAALNLWEALRECAPVLSRFGGHHYAAGFGVAAEGVAELRRKVNEVAESRLSMSDLVREIGIDGEAKLSELSPEAVSELNQLEPFGMGNPAPIVVTRGLKLCDASVVGNGAHLSLRLQEATGQMIEAMWFNQGALGERLTPGAVVDACHRPRLDEWNGSIRVRLYVEDLRLSGAS
jgi:single-stranded-DNA-specific exonuclease